MTGIRRSYMHNTIDIRVKPSLVRPALPPAGDLPSAQRTRDRIVEAPAPLLWPAVFAMIGIALDNALKVPLWLAILPVVLGAVWLAWRRGGGRAWAVSVCLASASVGAVRHALSDRWLARDHLEHFTRAEPVLTTVRGVVLGDPIIHEPKPDVPRAYDSGPRTRFLLEATAIEGTHGALAASGVAVVTIRAPVGSVGVGDAVQLTGWLYRILPPRNPGGYDWRLHNRRAGVRVGLSCDHAESVRMVTRRAAGGWTRSLQALRDHLRGYLVDEVFDEGEPEAGVLEAMVLGQRGAVSRVINEAFVRTGNSHFLAASGTNVGWVALIGWWLMTRVGGVHYRKAAVVVAALILVYVLVAEPQPSIWRAGVIGLLGCFSVYRTGRPHVRNWLACAALLILLFDPAALFRPAFQLSFLAVLALADIEPRLARGAAAACLLLRWPALAARFDPRRRESARPILLDLEEGRSLRRRLIGVLPVRLVTTSVAIWLATAPLVLYQFNMLTPWAPLGTLALWGLVAPLTCVGFLTVVAGLVIPSSAMIFAPLLECGTRGVLGLVGLLEQLPGTMLQGRSPSAAWTLCAYGILAWWVYRPGRLSHRRWLPWAAVLLAVWWWIPPRWVHRQPGALSAWFLAVGDGSATILELPDGRVIAFDLGTRSSFDAGPTIHAFLESRGITRLDAVYVSHTDFDHYSGIETLLRLVNIERIVITDHFEPFAPPGSSPNQFLASVRRRGVPIEIVTGHDTLELGPGLDARLLWPPPRGDRQFARPNDTSMVMKLTWQGRSILLTGDIEFIAMAGLLSVNKSDIGDATSREDLSADVLALPHHGGVVGNTAAFIAAVNPQVCIRSTGQRRAFTTSGIEDLCAGRLYFSTAEVGCVRVLIRDGAVKATSHLVDVLLSGVPSP